MADSGVVPFPRATKEIGDVCTQAKLWPVSGHSLNILIIVLFCL